MIDTALGAAARFDATSSRSARCGHIQSARAWRRAAVVVATPNITCPCNAAHDR